MRTRAWPIAVRLLAVAVLVAGSVAITASSDATGPRHEAPFVAAARPVLAAAAQPTVPPSQGELDPGFAAAGQAFTDLSGQYSEATGVAVQPDGRIVTVGTTAPAQDPGRAGDVAVLRYTPDGALDPSFGGDGVVTADVYGELDEAAAVVVQADGKLVVVGTTRGRTQSGDVLVLRFNPDGTPDTTFGDGGHVSVDIGNADAGYTVAIQPQDQKIVVGGTAAFSFMVLRLGVDGVLDDTFGGDGIVLTGSFNGERVNGVAVQPDGRIVGVGPSFGDVAVFRLLADGSIDFSFGQSYGFTYTDLDGDEDAHGVALRPDGTIAVAGRTGGSMVVLRYTGFGFLDGSFDGGFVTVDRSEGRDVALAITVVDDRVVVAGDSDGGALVSLDEDGALTAGFGDGGVAEVPASSATGIVTAQDGRLAIAGSTFTALGLDSVAGLFDAATGAPVESFGDGGLVATDVRSSGDELTAVAVDDQGRIVAAGHAGTGSGWDHAVARYDATGAFDPTFGTGGRTTVDVDGTDRAYGVAAAYGTVTVVGDTAIDGRTDFAVTRYLAFGDRSDGRPDSYFDGDGIVTTSLTDGEEGARAVVAQPDGGALVAGFADADFALVRYRSDGSLDPDFGDGGVVRTTVTGSFSQAKAMLVQPDGRIVVAGEVAEGEGGGSEAVSTLALSDILGDEERYLGDRDFAVVRYLPDGQLDPDFGDGGAVTVDLAGGNDEATAVALQPDGKIVVTGRVFPGISALSEIGTPAGIGVVRFEADGTLDTGFGSFGTVLLNVVDDRQSASSVAVAEDGDIVVGGLVASDVAVLRLDPDGALDEGFGDGGVARTDLGGNDEARALALLPGGGVLAAGVTRLAGRTAFALVAHGADGVPAASFGSGGVSVTSIAGDVDVARAMAVQPDGKVVVAGESRVGPAGDLAVVRYSVDGTLDSSFGFGGIATFDLAGGADGAYALAVQPDGAIVVVGDSARDVVVVRYLPDGFLDQGFGEGGVLMLGFFSGGEDDRADDDGRAVALSPSGAIVVAGSVSHPGTEGLAPFDDLGVARLLPDGSFDDSFADEGRTHTDFAEGTDAAFSVAVQPDGRIVVAGTSRTDSGSAVGPGSAVVARYDEDGALDPTFGGSPGPGQVLTDLGGDGSIRGLALAPSGAIVVAGSVSPPLGGPAATGRDVVALRLDPTGALDTGFGSGGLVRTAVDTDDTAGAVLVQPDGAVVVAAGVGGTEPDAALVRYRADGVPDPRFGEDGVAVSGGVSDSALAVAIQADGNLVVAGSTAVGPDDADATVLRFVGGAAGPIGPPADLAIELLAAAAAVRIDTPLRYTITVRNNGPGQADAVTVTDELPPTATLLGTTASQGEPCMVDGTELTCPLGTIAVGAEVGLTVTVQPTRLGPLVNTASVAGDQQDTNPANDSATVTTTVLPLSQLRANPGVVPLGRVVQMIGTGFLPGTIVALGYPGWPTTKTVAVAADGTFTAPFVVFTETTPGPRIVEARTPAVPPEVYATTNLLVVTDSLTPPNFVARN